MKENFYDYDFILEMEKNNEWLIKKIKEEDESTYVLLEKTKENVFELIFEEKEDLVKDLVQKYKTLLVCAYSYFLEEERMKR